MKFSLFLTITLVCFVSLATEQDPMQIPGFLGSDTFNGSDYNGNPYTETDYIYAYGSVEAFQSAFSDTSSFMLLNAGGLNAADQAELDEDIQELREQGFGSLVDAYLANPGGVSIYEAEYGDGTSSEDDYIVIIIPGYGDSSSSLSPVEQRVVEASELAVLAPQPQQTTQRSSSILRARALGRLSGIHAGVEPAVIADGGNSIHFEYNYIDTSLDTAGVGISGETNVYAIGYEHYFGSGLYLDFSYEYGAEDLLNGGVGIDNDTHTVAASLSKDLGSNLYGLLIAGGSWSDGATTLAGVPLLGTTGSIFFISPGLGTSWVFGDFVVDHSISYLYQNGSTRTTIGGVRVAGGAEIGQVVADLGATYNITDALYARVGLQYNNIVDENFAAGVPLDKNWLQINSEIGATVGAGATVYVGHAYDAGHTIYDTHTYRAGFLYQF